MLPRKSQLVLNCFIISCVIEYIFNVKLKISGFSCRHVLNHLFDISLCKFQSFVGKVEIKTEAGTGMKNVTPFPRCPKKVP